MWSGTGERKRVIFCDCGAGDLTGQNCAVPLDDWSVFLGLIPLSRSTVLIY